MKKILVCFWGQDKISSYLQNNPFMKTEYYEKKIISLNDLVINFKKIFHSYNLNFLWSTWSRCDIEQYAHNFIHILKHDEPEDFEIFLNNIDFQYVSQIRHDDRYKKSRQGYYTQFFHKSKIIDFIKKNNFQYDGLIICRTDIFFVPEQVDIFDFDKNIIYTPKIYWGSRGIGINDHIAIGNFNYLIKAIDFYDFENLNKIIYNSHNPEEVNAKIILNNNCIIEEFECEKYCRFPVHMS